MTEPFIGSIVMFAGNFAPRGWALCNGQLLSISQNTALFSILGTTYGGNGQTTFALPDLRGRVPLQAGQGPGLSSYNLGQQGGNETVTLTTPQMPTHNHSVLANNADANTNTATGNALANSNGSFSGDSVTVNSYTNASPNTPLSPLSIGTAGGSQPHENRPPYLGINFIIATEGIYPSRD